MENIDTTVILTGIGTVITIVGFVYTILRYFKTDINNHIDKLEKRMEIRMTSLEDRMFLLSTGKSLADAIKEERMKTLKE